METEVSGVEVAESPTAEVTQQTPDQTGQQPDQTGQQPAGQKPQGVPFSRFQEVNRGKVAAEAQVKQLSTRVQQLEGLHAAAQQQGGLSREQQQQYREASEALIEVMKQNPVLAKLLQMAQLGDRLPTALQGIEQLHAAQTQQQVRQGEGYIKGLADKAGMPIQNGRFLKSLVREVSKEVLDMEGGEDRFNAGDLSVFDEAFKVVKEEVFGTFTRDASKRQIGRAHV